MTHTPHWLVVLASGWALLSAVPGRAAPVSFRNEVMAVLARGGCSQGACHGSLNGKNGFKLSLRGQDPAVDYRELTHAMLARRADPLQPDASLLLIKATGAVPHEGGKRFDRHSLEYDLLRRWIAEGMRADPAGTPELRRLEVTPRSQVLLEPATEVQLTAWATFSDGRRRDVTALAVFEPSSLGVRVSSRGLVTRRSAGETTILVRYLQWQAAVQLAFVPARPDFVWREPPATSYIDEHVHARLRTLRQTPAPLCSDSVFLRRIYLDVLGVLPTADEARHFLADTRPDRRERLIDRVLERPEFADFWALKWSDLLRNEEKVLDPKGVQVFHDWIRHGIAEGKPLNEMARELVASRGSTYSHPAANFYRALRDPQARAEATAQVFLGLRLQCARCHNHPFDSWTQDDYHSLAAFFVRVRYRIVANQRRDALDSHEFNGEQVVWMARHGELLHPNTHALLAPGFPGVRTPALAADADRLQVLADWIARPNNPYFARTQANRIWYHLIGKGIVDPIDDFRASNPPTSAPLLDALARDLAEHHFDLRHLVRTILLSRTYQRSAEGDDTSRTDDTGFAHAVVRPLQAEVLLDALAQVTGGNLHLAGHPAKLRAVQMPGVRMGRGPGPASDSEKFLAAFGKPVRSLSCECERVEDNTLGQAFQLLTGPLLNRLLTQPDNRLKALLDRHLAPNALVEELYLAALCRLPTRVERDQAVAQIEQTPDRRLALEDLLWALLNAKELLLRQ